MLPSKNAKKGVQMAGRGAGATLMTNENFVISPEMIDEDQGKPPFLSAGSLKSGHSGVKSIDTLYENTSQDLVDNPRAMTTPTPELLDGPMYLHRRL